MPNSGTTTISPTRISTSGSAPAHSGRGASLRPAGRWATGPTRAEGLECTCPDFCERDHEQD